MKKILGNSDLLESYFFNFSSSSPKNLNYENTNLLISVTFPEKERTKKIKVNVFGGYFKIN